MSNASARRVLTDRHIHERTDGHRHTDGTDFINFIPLTTDAEGNKMPFNCICCMFKGQELVYTIFWGKPVKLLPQLQKVSFFSNTYGTGSDRNLTGDLQ